MLSASRRIIRHAAVPNLARRSARLMSTAKIYYTETDEAPALATYSLLPIVSKMSSKAGIEVIQVDISVAARILAQFPDTLEPHQIQKDYLAELGELAKLPHANIVKLPNISASVPQLNGAIAELRSKGYNVPLYVQEPTTDIDKENKERYAKVLGSAVNPVLREGNSDRRVAAPVKEYAQKNAHIMGGWSRASTSHVAHMTKGDFYASEKSVTMTKPSTLKIEHVATDGTVTPMKSGLKMQEGEIVDSSFISIKELRSFYEKEMESAMKSDMLLSLHLKATMMKISDPILFGHAVSVYFHEVFEKHADLFKKINVNVKNGLNDLYEKLKTVPEVTKQEVLADIDACYEKRPWLAMVNSAKGITNLHVPSDVIVDASMPCVVRDSGKMWNKDDELEDTKCLIPDRCYATMYQEVMSFCKSNGQFDVSTMGNVANVGLMAQKAEEYGSHDKTFEMTADGKMQVVDEETGEVYMEHTVEMGDVWRACQTKDLPIKDWVRLAVSRARATGDTTIFWLDALRGHDYQLIQKVNKYLLDHDTDGLDISIMTPQHAMRTTCERVVAGKNTISVTGNVLRDYLTDLFPILELGTSSKMLSIVPLLAGGGLFETGAGGSAPKHVDQFVKEGHLRWDSLGEYLAVAVSLEHLGETTNNDRAKLLGNSLNAAISRLLENRKSPGRKVNQIDNRASNFYICLYWAEIMAEKDPAYAVLATKLKAARHKIVEELKVAQGTPVDVGGYYKFDQAKVEAAMRPYPTFNNILDGDW